MKCKVCSNECNGNTCSGSCRAKLSRQARTLEHQDGAQIKRTRTVEPEAHAHDSGKRTQEAHAADKQEWDSQLEQTHYSYLSTPGEKVYGRQAVTFSKDVFGSRPMPDNDTDHPSLDNRCKYTRLDGSEYIIDSSGNTFDLSSSGNVYDSIQDVQACYEVTA